MEKRSFLAGLAVGRNLKGWSGVSTGAATAAPLCWNDPGVYDYFYIDYRAALREFSYGRFCNKTTILGAAGEIIPTAAERVDTHTVRIWGSLAGETRVRVFGNSKEGLTFADGRAVGAFAGEFWVDGDAPYELPYLAESWQAKEPVPGMEERAGIDHPAVYGSAVLAESTALLVPEPAAGEAVTVEYT